ncbi:hypothetical protein BFG52_08690 [Acinetobacter larvae]|uniref:Uncharacterized protein n=1 Tax=Acinetobacter larvae TaxID=1789224 RepID=A0A1B2LZR1_9GAMM|nr:hypothetical protein BFG52_08690 [Acinetobacter larvae]
MKNKILYMAYIIFSLYILFNLFYGFSGIMNNYDMRGTNGYDEFIASYVGDIRIFLINIFVSYVILFFLFFLLFKGKKLFFKYLSIINSILFLYGSIRLIYENYYRNYIELYELNSFVVLIDKYGSIINLTYCFPLTLAIANISFLMWMNLKTRR